MDVGGGKRSRQKRTSKIWAPWSYAGMDQTYLTPSQTGERTVLDGYFWWRGGLVRKCLSSPHTAKKMFHVYRTLMWELLGKDVEVQDSGLGIRGGEISGVVREQRGVKARKLLPDWPKDGRGEDTGRGET